MELSIDGDFSKLEKRLKKMQDAIGSKTASWAWKEAQRFDSQVRENLGSQGRGGQPPPLSPMTRHIYSIDGEPDGSGITNHIALEYIRRDNRLIAIVGIPKGKPTAIAHVQDKGATIAVTDRMRGFLSARYGIFLRQSTTHIDIPARQFWELAVRSSRKDARKSLKKLIRELTR